MDDMLKSLVIKYQHEHRCSYFTRIYDESHDSISDAVVSAVEASKDGYSELWGSPIGSGGPPFMIAGFRDSKVVILGTYEQKEN